MRLARGIRLALAWKPKPPSKPIFRFELSVKAAKENTKVLELFGNDLTKAIQVDKNSILKPGSEFRPWAFLKPIFQGHPLCKQMQEILTTGAFLPLMPLSEEEVRRFERRNSIRQSQKRCKQWAKSHQGSSS